MAILKQSNPQMHRTAYAAGDPHVGRRAARVGQRRN